MIGRLLRVIRGLWHSRKNAVVSIEAPLWTVADERAEMDAFDEELRRSGHKSYRPSEATRVGYPKAMRLGCTEMVACNVFEERALSAEGYREA